MSSYNFNSCSSSFTSSSFDDDDSGIKTIFQGAMIATNIYAGQRRKKCPRRRRCIHRDSDRIAADKLLKRDYFDDGCTYPNKKFRQQFRMNKSLFMRIHDSIVEHDPENFHQRRDAAHKLGLSSLQKVTTAIRMLAYGIAADQVDEYLKLAESTALKSMNFFCNAIIKIFGDEYLRSPTENDIQCILTENASKGFPDMLGCLDCEVPEGNFVVNGHAYTMGYYLFDDIHPKWATLMQTISQPINAKHKHFAETQEAVRKDVERAFGVLQARFGILKGSVRIWNRDECGFVMKACIILHNMIVEDEEDPENWEPLKISEFLNFNRDSNMLRCHRIRRIKAMMSEVTHNQLKLDLIEHLWSRRGDEL